MQNMEPLPSTSLEKQIDSFLEHFKRSASRAIDTEWCHLASTLTENPANASSNPNATIITAIPPINSLNESKEKCLPSNLENRIYEEVATATATSTAVIAATSTITLNSNNLATASALFDGKLKLI